MDLIFATASGAEVAVMPWNADFECGGTNSFEIEIPKRIWKGIEGFYDLVYVPGTEFGGMIGEIKSENEPNSIFLCGDTWRGMLTKKIIIPSAQTHYYTVQGNSRTIISKLLTAFFRDTIVQAAAEEGVQIPKYTFARYVDMMTGLDAMLGTVSRKTTIRYVQTAVSGYFAIGTAPIRNFEPETEDEIEVRSDAKRNGINHLICLGAGELEKRLVRHIYTDQYGDIVSKQVLKGRYENAAVYDNTGAATAEELIKGGTERLKELRSGTSLEVTTHEMKKEREIGDLIRVTDPITGITAWKKVERKILTITGGIPRIEYKLEGES